MASFLPHYQKKHLQLREMEGELIALLREGAIEEEVFKMGEEVRAAQIRAIKEKVAKLIPSEKSAVKMEELRAEIEVWEEKAVEAILEKYREKAARLKKPVKIQRAPRRGSW